MKLRWKEHEIIFVSMVTALLIAGYIKTSNDGTEKLYQQAHVPFNIFVNILIPRIGKCLLIYGVYLFVNFFTIPRFFFPKKFEAGTSRISVSLSKISLQGIASKVLKKYTWLIIQIAAITLVLGTAFTVFIYYEHEWLFHYPGFSFFPKHGHTNDQLIDVYGQYFLALFITVMYILYAACRDLVIHHLNRSSRRYLVLILNQVSWFLLVLLAIPAFYYAFEFSRREELATTILAVAIPGFLLFMINTYWLFPSKAGKTIFTYPVLVRVLLAVFVTTIPFGIGLSNYAGHSSPFLLLLAFQLLFVTPISWIYFTQKRDSILEIRGLETALVKSKTDLQFLRSQINPHFLFNTLNTLYGTALQEKADNTASGIQKLGDMMRFMLHENNLDFIQMSREIDYLRNYISLQKLRTQSSPDIIIEDDINDLPCHHKIAPMLLIPLVENAFKHGISLQEKSWIKIKLGCDEKNIRFEISNSMHVKKNGNVEKEKSGIGFKNVLERLKFVYGGRFQISVNGDGKEFFVKLAIQPEI